MEKKALSLEILGNDFFGLFNDCNFESNYNYHKRENDSSYRWNSYYNYRNRNNINNPFIKEKKTKVESIETFASLSVEEIVEKYNISEENAKKAKDMTSRVFYLFWQAFNQIDIPDERIVSLFDKLLLKDTNSDEYLPYKTYSEDSNLKKRYEWISQQKSWDMTGRRIQTHNNKILKNILSKFDLTEEEQNYMIFKKYYLGGREDEKMEHNFHFPMPNYKPSDKQGGIVEGYINFKRGMYHLTLNDLMRIEKRYILEKWIGRPSAHCLDELIKMRNKFLEKNKCVEPSFETKKKFVYDKIKRKLEACDNKTCHPDFMDYLRWMDLTNEEMAKIINS